MDHRRLRVLEQRPTVRREEHQGVRPRGLQIACVSGGGEAVLHVDAGDYVVRAPTVSAAISAMWR